MLQTDKSSSASLSGEFALLPTDHQIKLSNLSCHLKVKDEEKRDARYI